MLLTATAESGTSGSQLTAGGDFDVVSNGTSGSTFYDNSHTINGSLVYKTTSGSGNTYVGWSTSLGGSQTEVWLRTYCLATSNYTGGLCLLRDAGASAGKVNLTSAGKIGLVNAAGTTLATSSTTLPAGTPFRIELHGIASASPTGGTLEVRIFANKDATTPTETLGPFTTTQTAAAFDQVWFGPVGAGAGPVLYHDDLAVSNTGWIGASSTPPSAPTNTTPPSAPTGTPQNGSVLTASSTGTWSGNPAPTYTYQWRRCDSSGANGVNISGQTATTYTLASADIGSTIRVTVTATNTSGSASADSAATAAITDIPSTSVSLNNNADGSNGVAVTNGSSGGALGDAFDIVTITSGGSITYDSSKEAHGTASMHMVTAGLSSYVGWSAAVLGTQSDIYARMYLRFSADPANGAGVMRFASGSTTAATLTVTNAGLVRIRNAAGTALASGTTTIPLNTWVRLEAHLTPSTTAGAVTSRLYLSQDSTTISETLSTTGQALTAAVDQVDFGLINNATSGDTVWIDEAATDSSWIGPVATLAPRWGWGMVAAPGLSAGGPPQGGSRTAADVIWGMNLFNNYDAYYGTSETSSQAVTRYLASYDKIGMTKVFPNTISTFSSSLEGQTPGQRSVVCTSYDQVGMANGNFDSDIRSYVRSIPSGWYIILVNWQEPDDEMLQQGVFTPQQHVDASNHMADVVHDEIANGTLAVGATCEVWDCFEEFTVNVGYGGQKWSDSFAALRTDGIAWDIYGNPPPGARVDKNAGSRTPITGSAYGVGSSGYDPTTRIKALKTIVTRNGFSKWGLFEIGAPFRQGDIQSTTGLPDGTIRAQWFSATFDALIDQGVNIAMVFDLIGTGFDQRLIVGPPSNFVGSRSLLSGVSWNPASLPTPDEEPAVATIRSYFTQGL